ncbi:hypothetical protein ALC62_11178 [Cyphomyrmex costatus]|uniref:Uncharacterized protein n=1 Tax=Cyphomyrmex costatus TaxID=456900 RepID=A0A195CBL0_9HYME|nr:hypothetical protein ALC62_11178 [Cyphomyrmex costatus]
MGQSDRKNSHDIGNNGGTLSDTNPFVTKLNREGLIDSDKNEKDGTIPRETEDDGGNRDEREDRCRERKRMGYE